MGDESNPPEHTHCYATFYDSSHSTLDYATPVSVLFFNYQQIHPGLGLLLVLDFDRSKKIVKKLKLTGVRTRFSRMLLLLKICYQVRWKSLKLEESMSELFLGLEVE